jgi:tetratricopeptide (TPR) repeat protein
MKRSTVLMAVLASMLLAATASAGIQDAAKEEADAYKAVYEAINAKDLAKGFPLAKEFLTKFPASKYSAYLKTYVTGSRAALFNQARQAKNISEEIKLGNEALAEEPENIDYLYLLALDIRAVELYASPPNYSHATEAADYSRRTIKLIEGGKVPAVVDKAKWNQNQQLGGLYHAIGLIEAKNKNTEKAIEAYAKAATLDPTSPTYFLGLGSLYQEKYLAAAKKYQDFPQADREAAEPKPEVKGALDEANANADKVIDNWARFMALTVTSEPWKSTRDQVNGVLTNLYNYRHPGDADGLQKLIDQYKTSAAPAASAASRQ